MSERGRVKEGENYPAGMKGETDRWTQKQVNRLTDMKTSWQYRQTTNREIDRSKILMTCDQKLTCSISSKAIVP